MATDEKEVEATVTEETAAAARAAVMTRAAEQYRANRKVAAELSLKLTGLEMTRTEMRGTIIAELMKSGLSKTAATDQARTTKEYVSISTDIATTTADWELAFVEAEYHRMVHSNQMAQHIDAYTARNTMAELERMRSMIEGRMREVQE